MADPGDWTRMPDVLALLVFLLVFAAVVFVIFVLVWCGLRASRWMRLFRLGGVTTLTRTLIDPCTLCLYSMEAGEKVRTLSCDHVFHCGGTVKCEVGIDGYWLRNAREMLCPICRQSPQPVLPRNRPPPSSSSSASAQDLEAATAPLLPREHDQTLPEAASSSSAPASTSTQDLEALTAPLLPRAHDQTLPEATSSSSAPVPPPSSSAPASTQDLQAPLLPPVHDQALPEASSSAPAPPLPQPPPTSSTQDSEEV